jgi:RNA polymerase sigma-70 factor (ECF subfamily)
MTVRRFLETTTPQHSHAAHFTGPDTDSVEAAMLARSLDDPALFAEIYDRFFPEIHRYMAGRMGRDAADDLAADTFLVAFRKRDRVDPAMGGMRPWLYGVATILIANHRRQETRRYRALSRTGREGSSSVESHDDRVASVVAAQELGPSLAGALADLGQGDRDVLLLAAISELSHQEIALALGIPYGTVGSRLNRARRKVRAALGDVESRTELPEARYG